MHRRALLKGTALLAGAFAFPAVVEASDGEFGRLPADGSIRVRESELVVGSSVSVYLNTWDSAFTEKEAHALVDEMDEGRYGPQTIIHPVGDSLWRNPERIPELLFVVWATNGTSIYSIGVLFFDVWVEAARDRIYIGPGSPAPTRTQVLRPGIRRHHIDVRYEV